MPLPLATSIVATGGKVSGTIGALGSIFSFGKPDRAKRCQGRGFPSNIRNSNHCPDEMPDFEPAIYADLGANYFDVHRAMVVTSPRKWNSYTAMYWIGTLHGTPKQFKNPLDINSTSEQKFNSVIKVHGYTVQNGNATKDSLYNPVQKVAGVTATGNTPKYLIYGGLTLAGVIGLVRWKIG